MIAYAFGVIDRVDKGRNQGGFCRCQLLPRQFHQILGYFVLQPIDEIFAPQDIRLEFRRPPMKKLAPVIDGFLGAAQHIHHFLDRLLDRKGGESSKKVFQHSSGRNRDRDALQMFRHRTHERQEENTV